MQLARAAIAATMVLSTGPALATDCTQERAIYADARDIYTLAFAPVDSESSALSALSLMTRRRFRHLPVMKEGRMTGFISIGDLVKARIDMIEQEAEALRSYISG